MSDELWSVELGRGIGVIELGATREEIARRLAEHKIELDLDDEDDWLWVEELDAELRFKTTKPPVLREILVEDDQLRFASLPVIGKRLHEVVELLKVSDGETMWRIEQDDEEDERAGAIFPEGVTTDEMLLDDGTLWIPALGLGLGMVRGEITTVRLRKPGETPKSGLGPLTASQRGLSARADLPRYLVNRRLGLSRPVSWMQTVLGVGLAAALVWLFWTAIDYQRRWNAAPVVEGEIVSVDPPPPDPFPMKFTVAYRDQAGVERTTVFERADIYANSVGDKVDVRYLPEAPDQPMGPARLSDAAFLKYVPWGIGIGAVYCVLQIVAGVVGLVMGRLKTKVPAVAVPGGASNT
jgi:Protein of unknown function (DUF3592)